VKLFVKNLLFTILVPGTVAVYVPLIITPDRGFTNNAFLLVVGFLLLEWVRGSISGRCGILPVLEGLSTLDAPKRLV
jgi:hypothetical protein